LRWENLARDREARLITYNPSAPSKGPRVRSSESGLLSGFMIEQSAPLVRVSGGNRYDPIDQQPLRRSNSDGFLHQRSFERRRPDEERRYHTVRTINEFDPYRSGIEFHNRICVIELLLTVTFTGSRPRQFPSVHPDEDKAYSSLGSPGIVQPRDTRISTNPLPVMGESSQRPAVYANRPSSPAHPNNFTAQPSWRDFARGTNRRDVPDIEMGQLSSEPRRDVEQESGRGVPTFRPELNPPLGIQPQVKSRDPDFRVRENTVPNTGIRARPT
jgi:hypothetical protein